MLNLATAGLVSFLYLPNAGAAVPSPSDGQVKYSSVPATRLAAPSTTSDKSRRLDLRPPEIVSSDKLFERSSEPHTAFTSFSRHDLVSMHDDSGAAQSSHTAPANNERTLTRTEVLANQFRRQGLPVARLWENDSALVHLGLNQRGKPGLWIVQKLR